MSYYEIQGIGLPTRVANSLIKSGYYTVYDIMKAKDKELLRCRGLGQKSLKMVRSIVHGLGETEQNLKTGEGTP